MPSHPDDVDRPEPALGRDAGHAYANGNEISLPASDVRRPAGLHFPRDGNNIREKMFVRLGALDLNGYLAPSEGLDSPPVFALRADLAGKHMAHSNTMQLRPSFGLDPDANEDDLEREIILAMLAAPRALRFPNYEEFHAAVRVRCNIVHAARRTQLAFHTSEAERPAGLWQYTRGRGFTVIPGTPLSLALERATQPALPGGELYAFSCYRASEYVILLAIVQQLAVVNPALLQRLQGQWERRAIMSGEFHAVFLHEYGSMAEPLPQGYYIPGDRVWFRNPDARSSDASGYEGSWVFYIGGGLFSNFWKRDQPYSLEEKCVEIFHWRHGTYLDGEGELRMDEAVVEARVRETLEDPVQRAYVLSEMMRLRDPSGVYAEGGCIDSSREFPGCICLGTADIALPLDQDGTPD